MLKHCFDLNEMLSLLTIQEIVAQDDVLKSQANMRAAQSILQFTQACLLQKMLGILLCWPQGGAMLAKGFMKMRATATATRCRSNPRNKDAVVAKVAAQAVARAEVAATAEDAGLALQHRRQRQNAAMRHQKNQQAGSRSSQSKSAQGKLTSLLNLRRKRLTSRRTLAKKQPTRSRNAAQMWQALRRNDQRKRQSLTRKPRKATCLLKARLGSGFIDIHVSHPPA